MADPHAHLRLGTRGSLLARMQSGLIADALRAAHPGLRIELIEIRTTGDRITEKPLHEFGGKGLFTKELEQALLAKEIDFAVHSLKDVPITMPLVDQSGLTLAAIPAREDVRDVLVSQHAKSLRELKLKARVGTSSLRRRCQVLAAREDLDVQFIRGNIDTRIRKLINGEFDAIILALAGVKRAKLFDASIMHPIELEQMLPAAGQGALALQCRKDDIATRNLLAVLNDPPTAAAVDAERHLVRELNGDCHSPIAALAQVADGTISFSAAVGRRDGGLPVVRASAAAPIDEAQSVVLSVLRQLQAQNVEQLLAPATAP